jgi:uncharacterized membrane protein YhfC
MTDILNIASALLTIALGCFGWLAPRYTAAALDLKTGASTMGLSELRASVGCLFVGLGIAALLIGTPTAYVMMGCAYAGAAAGRATSLLRDAPPFRKAFVFFAVEAALAAWLIAGNL